MSDMDSHPKLINESMSSHKDEIYKKTLTQANDNLEQSMKTFSSQILNTVNNSLQILNSDYEKNIEKNKDAHDKCIGKLKGELNDFKKIHDNESTKLSNLKNQLYLTLQKNREMKIKNNLFFALKRYSHDSKTLKYETNTVVNSYYYKKRLSSIISNWKNIARRTSKEKVVAKYSKLFQTQQENLEKQYSEEVNNLLSILQKLETAIKKEVDERKLLSNLYDVEMNKGAGEFIGETQLFKDFNSSDVQP